MLISLDNVAFGYGDNLILEKISFSINEGEKVGLIGANGEGKTTLIKLILGQLIPDVGSIITKNGIKIGYLEQNGGYSSASTVYDEMKEIFAEEYTAVNKLSTLSASLAETDYNSKDYQILSAKIESLNKFLTAHDCFDVDVKIKTVLNGMGFSAFYDRVIDSMSGGEKTRLKLARLLLEEPDILILDEPTNHLDINTMFWLEDYLSAFKGAVFVVSHDRYFLDRIVTRVLEIENRHLTSFKGNYSKYKVLKAELYIRQLKEYEAQQQEREKLQDYVDRNIVRATTAKSAQSRVKQLDKMELLEKPYTPPAPPKYIFNYDLSSYEAVLDIENLNLEIDGKQLISGGQLNVTRGDKLAIVGENGTGKSTLLKTILSGNNAIRVGRFVKIAYYDQEGANLDGDNSVLDELWNRHLGLTQTEVRSALARCGLFAEDMYKPVKALSGGERAKLALCILECERGNLIILDEPTNHLDLPARESLEKALQKYDGTLIFVSHDRYFISALATRVVEIENKKLNVYEGGYEYYNDEKKKRGELIRAEEEKKQYAVRENEREKAFRSKKERAEEEKRKLAVKKLESEISELENEENEINNKLSDSKITCDYVKLGTLSKRLEEIKESLDTLYNQYADMI
jgi:ATP-binding cassette subfamily F protein 3